MAEDGKTKLKITLGACQLEYAGSEMFLQTEVLKLVKAVDDLKTSKLVVPLNILQSAIGDSRNTQREVDDLIVSMKNDFDSLTEISEMESLRLQLAMDRLSKLMSVLSNLIKKMSDTAETITQNLK